MIGIQQGGQTGTGYLTDVRQKIYQSNPVK